MHLTFLVTSDKKIIFVGVNFASLETSVQKWPKKDIFFFETSNAFRIISSLKCLSKHQEEGNQDICKFRFFGDLKCFPYPFISQMSLKTPGGRKCLDCSWRRNKKQKCCGQKGGEEGNNC